MASRQLTCLIAGVVSALNACAEDDPPPPSLPPSDADDTNTGQLPPPGDAPGPCDLPGDNPGGSGDGGGDGGGFKFDVGPDDGGGFDFPVSCDDVEDSHTNLGCEFWAVDLPNDGRGTPTSPPAADQQFSVVVANASALDPANVSVFLGAEPDTPLDTAIVEVDATYTFELDPQSIAPDANSYDGVAFRIESDVPITAYQFNPLDNTIEVYSNDASVLFPTHVMGNDYTAITGNAVLLAMSEDDPEPVNAGAFISIVATEDGTTVDTFPKIGLYAGAVKNVDLDRGSVMTLLSDGSDGGNLSGTRVASNKPVAVFSGNVATVEPLKGGQGECCADHMEHQMLPLEAWGLGYAVAPPPSTEGSQSDPAVYRVTGSFDGTRLAYCPNRPPGAPETIGAYEYAVFESEAPFTVRSRDNDKPFSITQFLESSQATGRSDGLGDPAMLALPAAAQFQPKYVFAVPPGYDVNFVSIVVRGSGSIQLDGADVDDSAFEDLGVLHGHRYRYAHFEVTDGSHTIEADVPVGITVIGYDAFVSYGFPGGLGLRVIAPPPPAG